MNFSSKHNRIINICVNIMFYFWMIITIRGVLRKENVVAEIIITATLWLVKGNIKKSKSD